MRLATVRRKFYARSSLCGHSFGSSFAEEAAAANSAPSIRLRVGGHIYGVDASYRHCNNAIIEHSYEIATAYRSAALTGNTELEATEGGCYVDSSFGK